MQTIDEKIEELQDVQGWSDNTVLRLIVQYMETFPSNPFVLEIIDHLETVAKDENDFSKRVI